MTTQTIAAQLIAHQTVQAFEFLAHIGCTGCQIHPRRRSHAEHQARSAMPINSASKIASIRSPISIRRPFPSTKARLEDAVAFISADGRTSTANKRGAATACRTRMRYLSRVATARPRPAQNNFRLSPLASYSVTKASTAARLRRPFTPLCSALMPTLQHDFQAANKVVSSDGYSQSATMSTIVLRKLLVARKTSGPHFARAVSETLL